MSDTGGSGAPVGGDGGGSGDAGAEAGAESAGEDRTFTQADVDEAVKSRLAAERKKFGDLNELKRKASELDKLEAAKKTEIEQLTDKANQAETKASGAELARLKLEAALDHAPDDMSKAQVRKLAGRLQGGTEEELAEDAKQFFADYGGPKSGDGDGQDGSKPDPDRRPREAMDSVPLPGGEKIQIDEETDPRKLAARIPT